MQSENFRVRTKRVLHYALEIDYATYKGIIN